MQALVVVLRDPFPVRRDLVEALAGALEGAGPVALEVPGEVADVLVGVGCLAGEVDQDEAADDREPDRDQAPARAVEVLDPVHVRSRLERAVEPVGPGVVGAPQALSHLALRLLDDPRAAVAADVQERPRPAVLGADHDDAVGAELAHHELAGLVDGRDVADADPRPEQVRALPIEDSSSTNARG